MAKACQLETCIGMGIHGTPAELAGFPRGLKLVLRGYRAARMETITTAGSGIMFYGDSLLRDSRGNVSVYDVRFMVYLHRQVNTPSIFFANIQNFTCILNYNDNANGTSVSVNVGNFYQ